MTVNFTYQDNKLKTEVVDTGIGMRQEDLQKLFKFFGTLSKSKDINRGGMGLGLSISKLIVNSLGGDISVDSVLDKGSKFTFIIPITEVNGPSEIIQEKIMRPSN